MSNGPEQGMKIPIRNLYFLLLYAWDLLEEGEAIDLAGLKSDQPIDLLAYVLAKGFERVIKRGIDRSYVNRSVVLQGVRGAIDFSETLATAAFTMRKLVCGVDELDHDNIQNRILKTTMAQLSQIPDLDKDIRKDLRNLMSRLPDVNEIRITSSVFASVQLHRNNRQYSLLLQICRLVYESLTVDEAGADRRFTQFIRDEKRMTKVFEAFVRNLLSRRLGRRHEVGSRRLSWFNVAGSGTDLSLLPTLNMDVVVESPGRTLIIDTKYTPTSLVEYQGKERFRTPHLYQIYSYLKNYASTFSNKPVEGLLLYPAIGAEWSSQIKLDGIGLRVATLNLDQDWLAVEKGLVALVLDNLSPRDSPVPEPVAVAQH